MESKKKKGLSIREGVDQAPSNINPYLKRGKGATRLSLEEYVRGIRTGNRVILSQAITLIESKLPKHQELAQQILEACLPYSGGAFRLGITGSPGVGKSTFIERFGLDLLEQQKKITILAIDPSSQLTRGSILGDKTRMEALSRSEDVFIRPTPSGQTLGGVARKTRETILLCEAAGFDTIIIETVGVGQSEIAVHSMVDFFLLLLLPGGGDELQGIKRGIVEMADMIAVNKADGERLGLAKQAKRAYQNALHLFPPKESGWTPPVVLCSGMSGMGIPEINEYLGQYVEMTADNGYFEKKRLDQAKYWLYETIQQRLRQLFFTHPKVKERLPAIEKDILEGKLSSFQGAERLLNLFDHKNRSEKA
jgi:LAO/AO transport system kinase